MISDLARQKQLKPCAIVDFMSLVRKILMRRLNAVNDALA